MNSSGAVISRKEKICFALGDVAGNGGYLFISSYLLFFCTDVLHMELGRAGFAMTLGRFAEAAACLYVGLMINRGTKQRTGYCPYIQKFSPVLFFVMALLFCTLPAKPQAQFFWCAALYVLFSVLFVCVNVPYTSLLSVITGDSAQRLSLNVYKNVGSNFGALLVTACTLPLVALFGENRNAGFLFAATVFAVLFCLCSLACARGVRERVATPVVPGMNLARCMRIAWQCKEWKLLCCAQLCTLTYYVLRTQNVVYYAKYCLGNELFGSVLLSAAPVISLVVSLYMPRIARALGTKGCILWGNGLWCAALLLTLLFPKNLAWVFVCTVAANAGMVMGTNTVLVMVAKVADMLQQRFGVRIDGFMIAVLSFFQKIGIMLAGILGSGVLQLFHFTAGDVPTPFMLNGIWANFIWLPVLFSALVMLLIRFYPKERDAFERK